VANITGRVTSVMVFENRANLFILHVTANEFSGSFNCDINNLTLDGEHTDRASEIAGFVESRHLTATLFDVDDTTGGTGSRQCGKIALQTVLE